MNIFLCVCYSVGRPKHVRVMAGALEGDLFIGPKAEVMVPGALLRSFFQDGIHGFITHKVREMQLPHVPLL